MNLRSRLCALAALSLAVSSPTFAYDQETHALIAYTAYTPRELPPPMPQPPRLFQRRLPIRSLMVWRISD